MRFFSAAITLAALFFGFFCLFFANQAQLRKPNHAWCFDGKAKGTLEDLHGDWVATVQGAPMASSAPDSLQFRGGSDSVVVVAEARGSKETPSPWPPGFAWTQAREKEVSLAKFRTTVTEARGFRWVMTLRAFEWAWQGRAPDRTTAPSPGYDPQAA